MVKGNKVSVDIRMPGACHILVIACFAAAGLNLATAATGADRAVFNVIHQADPALVNDRIVYRGAVTTDLDLVIAIGSPANWPLSPDSPAIWWSEKQKLGLFLQEKARPDRVYELALAAGSLDCGARIERATSTDTVISCLGEKSYQGLNQKFVYDIRAKALVSRFAYQPFAMMRVLDVSGHTVFVGADLHQLLAVEFQPGGSPEFRILSKAEAAPWLGRVKTAQESVGPELSQILYIVPDDPRPVRFGPGDAFTFARGSIIDNHRKEYPLPQSTYDDFAKARARRVTDNYIRANTTIAEKIGPVQPEGDKLWFGKTFYDGEGNSGVGSFGYFDTSDRQYHLFVPPELADYSVSAIRVEPDAVWMGIYQSGEYGGSPAGVLRYDRKTQAVHKYELPDAVYGLTISGKRTLMPTSSGIAVIDGDEITRYLVDRTTDGRLRIAKATR
ncbi:MAG TPA: hypothetical protein VHZ74_10180 [Bryobacteraceae bacterium]|nr:hypothetical protein [Bryobacteraceae bacterium]